MNIDNDGNFCFIWSTLAHIHPCNDIHPNTVSNYRPSFTDLNIDGLDFTNGFKCTDVREVEKLNDVSINLSEVNSYQYHYVIT